MIVLKNYQKKSLDVLSHYLEQARFVGAKKAYESMAKQGVPSYVPYQPAEGLANVPYICLRLPTGGGKTLLSAHTVRLAAEKYLEQDYPIVLWMVPTNAIRSQTLETLKMPGHPNRQILQDTFNGRFMVLDIADFTQIRPQDLRDKAVVVITTMQTLRVENTEGRKVYAHNENLESHFSKVPDSTPNMERIEEGENKGKIKFSFRNLLNLHRPLVIVDEAHNASTSLSFEVLQRVNAACIVEYTATPVKTSNILHNVSASELKAEDMIKLPIRLTEHKTWEQAIGDSIRTREKLAEMAKKDKDYIRPIVLFQAENADRDINKDAMLDYLINQEHIARERIAVVTGDQKELDGINLFDPNCPIDYVITVQALKEGWDCSFAYVFCSVANVRSKKDIEQLLGRVMRMPYAKRRSQPGLNKAYAHVSTSSWPQAAALLHDRLVEMGFDRIEADQFIEPQTALDVDTPQEYKQPPSTYFSLREAPDTSDFNADQKERFKLEEQDGGFKLTMTGYIGEEEQAVLVKAIKDKEDRAALKTTIDIHNAQIRKVSSPSERGEEFNVPQLCLLFDGDLELAEKELFLGLGGWKLSDNPARLSPSEFQISEDGESFEFDIEGDQLQYKYSGKVDQLNLDLADTGWTETQLVRWLDTRLRQADIRQEDMVAFLVKVLSSLESERSLTVSILVRARYILLKVLEGKIKQYRQKAYNTGYQKTLFGPDAAVQTSFEFGFKFDPNRYPAHWFYKGAYQFSKHYYAEVGELKNTGEEFECAQAIDRNSNIEYWVRNLERQERFSLWLPTSTDKFYPDFVAKLKDGRILVVEYKGEAYATNGDSKEKKALGELYAEKSGGKALFLMAVSASTDPTGRDVYRQIEEAIK